MNFIFLIEFRFFFFLLLCHVSILEMKIIEEMCPGICKFSIFEYNRENLQIWICVEFRVWIWTFKHRVLILIFKVQYLDAIYKTADWNLKFLTIIPHIRNTRSGSKRKYVNSLDFKWNKDILCWYFIFR